MGGTCLIMLEDGTGRKIPKSYKMLNNRDGLKLLWYY